jgi:hypothetical protein
MPRYCRFEEAWLDTLLVAVRQYVQLSQQQVHVEHVEAAPQLSCQLVYWLTLCAPAVAAAAAVAATAAALLTPAT